MAASSHKPGWEPRGYSAMGLKASTSMRVICSEVQLHDASRREHSRIGTFHLVNRVAACITRVAGSAGGCAPATNVDLPGPRGAGAGAIEVESGIGTGCSDP